MCYYCPLLVDECVGHDAQLLNLGALLLGQVLHGLLGVEAGPGVAVAVNLPLVLPRFQRALESLVVQKWTCFTHTRLIYLATWENFISIWKGMSASRST